MPRHVTNSPAEKEYNKLLEQTNRLLESISADNDSSTLQLMDFDGVMTRWSRFHSEVDGARKGGGAASIDPRGHGDGGYINQDETLK